MDPRTDAARKAAQAISRGPWAVLGRIEKDKTLEAIADYIVVARPEFRSALARDELLIAVLAHRVKYSGVEVHSFAELAAFPPDAAAKEVRTMLKSRAEARRWPERVRVLRGGRDTFLMLDDRPAQVIQAAMPERPAGNGDSFARAFNDAFDRLRRDRPFNLVELSALRTALPGYSREEFDQELYALRKDSLFVLETFEGRHGSLSTEERDAAIREGGQVFAYAARREHG